MPKNRKPISSYFYFMANCKKLAFFLIIATTLCAKADEVSLPELHKRFYVFSKEWDGPNSCTDAGKWLEVNQLLKDVEEKIAVDEKDTLAWLVKGQLERALAKFAICKLSPESETPYRLETKETYIAAAIASYRKSLELNEHADNPQKLTMRNLSRITHDVLATADVRVKAVRQYIALFKDGKTFQDGDDLSEEELGDDINYEEFEYDSLNWIVTYYLDEDRFDEAQGVLDEMGIARPDKIREIEEGKASVERRRELWLKKQLEVDKGSQMASVTNDRIAIPAEVDRPLLRMPEEHLSEAPIRKEGSNLWPIVGSFSAIAIAIAIFLIGRWKRK